MEVDIVIGRFLRVNRYCEYKASDNGEYVGMGEEMCKIVLFGSLLAVYVVAEAVWW